MTRGRTALAGTAALCAAVLVFVAWLLPPRAPLLEPPRWRPSRPVVHGAFHVHTLRSDGTGSPDQVAAAAARAGLQFVILTDHGDATRRPDPPTYRSGVLCLDAVEISSNAGHYVALGLGNVPYPLGGDGRDVVEDVARLGGMGIVSHPDSRKPALAWSEWDAPLDGVEWLNADSEWRAATRARLAAAVVTYPFRGPETLAALFRRPAFLDRLDVLEKQRRVVVMAGIDAHARIGLKQEGDPRTEHTLVRLPSYESAFRAFSVYATLDKPFSRKASEDAESLLAAIRGGHVHTILDALARGGAFEFTGRSGAQSVIEGDSLSLEDAAILRVRANVPRGGVLVLLRDGREVNRVSAGELIYATNRAGTYRAEARLGGEAGTMPWAVSNPIFVGMVGKEASATAAAARTAPVSPASTVTSGRDEKPLAVVDAGQDWHPEHDPTSAGTVARDGQSIVLDFRLGSGPSRSQFSALSHHGTIPPAARALAFRAAANVPMRLSVQLRAQPGKVGQRWERSVYVDATPRDFVVPLAEMRPAGSTSSSIPPAAAVTSILFVVDRTHAFAGASGRFSIDALRVLGDGEGPGGGEARGSSR